MKTHNLVIYHCLCCGSVLHCEPDQPAPQCCGRSMVKAAAETVVSHEGEETKPEPHIPADAIFGVQQKPR